MVKFSAIHSMYFMIHVFEMFKPSFGGVFRFRLHLLEDSRFLEICELFSGRVCFMTSMKPSLY